jgi:hypothetical protein
MAEAQILRFCKRGLEAQLKVSEIFTKKDNIEHYSLSRSSLRRTCLKIDDDGFH